MTLEQIINKFDGLNSTIAIIKNTDNQSISTYKIKMMAQKVEKALLNLPVQKIVVVNNTITIYVGGVK